MRRAAIVVTGLIGALSFTGTSLGANKITTEDSACVALKQRAAIMLDQKIIGPASGWWCDVTAASDFYVIGLHSGSPCEPPGNKVCSNLLGWYAVRKSNGQLLHWNMAQGTPGAPL